MKDLDSDNIEKLNSENIEKYVLGVILGHSPSFAKVADIISEKDFFLQKHQSIFYAMKKIFYEGGIDIYSVDSMLKKMGRAECSLDYLFTLAELAVSPANIDYHAKQIKDFSTLRALVKLGEAIKNKSCEDEIKAQEAISFATEGLYEITKQNRVKAVVREPDISDDFFHHLRNNENMQGMPTGFFHLDNLLDGGLRATEMTVIAAGTSVGKTTLALNIASNWLRKGKSVLFFSLEMKKRELKFRQICYETEINSSRFKSTNFGKEQIDVLENLPTVKELRETKFIINDSNYIDMNEIRIKCEIEKNKKEGLDLVVIDYLQLIKTSKAETRAIAIGEISGQIKAMAGDLDIPVICLAQINRDFFKEKREPELHDLKESSSIEQDSDQVWFIIPVKENKHIVKLKIAKNRNGRMGNIFLEHIGEQFRFKDYDPKLVPGKDGFLPVEP